MDTNIMPKNANIFVCELCDFKSCKQSNFLIHNQTAKHIKRYKMIQNDTKKDAENEKHAEKKYKCECGRLFSYHSGLWRHMKNCKENLDENNKTTDNPSDKQIMMMLIKDNSEMKKMMMEVIKNGTHNTIHNTTNSNNKTFNLQFFLNEQCKDALNINDFIDSIQIQVKDLEETGKLGYVEGISKVVIDNLNSLTVHKRPIHCSDSKREVIYIKEDEEWTKDNETKDKLKTFIKKVAHKNMKQIPEWVKTHPECFDSNSKQNDKYLKIVSNSMSGSTEQEQKVNMDKIISKVAKEVIINK